jgi:hypothetical protein
LRQDALKSEPVARSFFFLYENQPSNEKYFQYRSKKGCISGKDRLYYVQHGIKILEVQKIALDFARSNA